MIEQLSRPEVQAFLAAHEKADPSTVAMMKNLPEELPEAITPFLLASQLKARQKAKQKLPSWHARDGMVFPHGVALEQCSSETTALWKTRGLQGQRFADLTGGTGVDSWAFSKVFSEGMLVEPDEERCRLAKHNLALLGASNISVVQSSAEQFLTTSYDQFGLIYLDPDRRAGAGRAVAFHDCVPDVVHILPVLLKMSDLVMIKASPMLDIQRGIKELSHVEEVVVLAVNNEVKEVLFRCKQSPGTLRVRAVNLFKAGEESFDINPEQEKIEGVEFAEPAAYIYEPNAAILKAGAFKSAGKHFDLKKLHPNTHLYTSAELVDSFPGRIFKVLELVPFSSKVLKAATFAFNKAHVITRNFPMEAPDLQKKLKLQEGEEGYIIGTTTLSDKKVLMVAERVK